MTAPEALRLEYIANFEYSYAIGKHASKFMAALRDDAKLFGISCPSCKDVLVPPRPVCGRCGVETDGWVEVGP
ncbi:MAG: zinc ribbon domain-containing protein, partial [Acidimicrobiia bacterium]